MKYLEVMVKLISKIKEYNHKISQVSILAIGKSRGAEKIRGGDAGKQSELR